MSKFDWVRFHRDLDVALATWIMAEDSSINRPFIDFLEYSNKKQLAQATSKQPNSKEGK